MKRGDLVEVRWPNAKELRLPPRFHAVIVGSAGSDNYTVMDAAGHTCQPFRWSCHPVVLTAALTALRDSIRDHAQSDAGRAAILTSRLPATAVYKKKTIDGRMIRHEIEMPIAPGGHGSPDYRVEPWVLAEGYTGVPTETLLRHIEFWGARMDGARAVLSETLDHTLYLIVDRGMSHADAAAALGISEDTLNKRLYRARQALRRAVGTTDDLLAQYSAKRGEDVTNRG